MWATLRLGSNPRFFAQGPVSLPRDTERGTGILEIHRNRKPSEGQDLPLQRSLFPPSDPKSHLALGRALAPLRDEGVLIIGSGSSYHNLGALMSERIGFYPNKPREESAQFDSWLRKTLTDFSSRQRSQHLLNWERAPFARAVHPQEDHLVPLHVVVGAAEDESAHLIYAQDDFFGKITMSSYRFGN